MADADKDTLAKFRAKALNGKASIIHAVNVTRMDSINLPNKKGIF